MRIFGAPQFVHREAQISRLERHALGVEVIDDGVVPRCIKSKVTTDGGGQFNGWKGGVYDRSGIVCESSLHDRHWTKVLVAYQPEEIDTDDIEYISGEAVYGGVLFEHFGHFLLESTNRLWWPLREGFKGYVVFQNVDQNNRVSDHARRFFDLLNISSKVITVGRSVRFDRVIVPERAFVIQKRVFEEFRIPFLVAGDACERLASPATVESGRLGLYLSRLNYQFRRSLGEEHLEDSFRKGGYDIVSMEALSLEHQIMTMRRYSTVAGIAGSAFHLMLFSERPKNATYILRDVTINSNYFMIDQLMSNNSVYIYNDSEHGPHVRREYGEDATLDLQKIHKYLSESGIIDGE